MMLALWPLGVPKVRSSRPLLAINPDGRDMADGGVFCRVSGITLTSCRDDWNNLKMGVLNMRRTNRKVKTRYKGRMGTCRFSELYDATIAIGNNAKHGDVSSPSFRGISGSFPDLREKVSGTDSFCN